MIHSLRSVSRPATAGHHVLEPDCRAQEGMDSVNSRRYQQTSGFVATGKLSCRDTGLLFDHRHPMSVPTMASASINRRSGQ